MYLYCYFFQSQIYLFREIFVLLFLSLQFFLASSQSSLLLHPCILLQNVKFGGALGNFLKWFFFLWKNFTGHEDPLFTYNCIFCKGKTISYSLGSETWEWLTAFRQQILDRDLPKKLFSSTILNWHAQKFWQNCSDEIQNISTKNVK